MKALFILLVLATLAATSCKTDYNCSCHSGPAYKDPSSYNKGRAKAEYDACRARELELQKTDTSMHCILIVNK